MAEQRNAVVEQACRRIEGSETPPTLSGLARSAGMSPYHFHRVFKAATGVTPKAYAAAHRAGRMRGALMRSRNVTEAIHDAGFNSSGHFYEKSNALLGMTPTQYRVGAADMKICFAVSKCSLGRILVAASERGICSILIGDDVETLARDLRDRFPRADLTSGDKRFERTVGKVVRFIELPAQGLGLPLDVRGTAFQLRVWQALQKIPVGSTATYTEIARRIGKPKSVRAVARACAANAIAVAVPCHRVVRSDGGLAGYRWGIERKQHLLAREVLPPSPCAKSRK